MIENKIIHSWLYLSNFSSSVELYIELNTLREIPDLSAPTL